MEGSSLDAIPTATGSGDLPLGVHRASLRELLDCFGVGSRQRIVVAERFERIYRLVLATGQLYRSVVFGSFVTDKSDPNDVDVFMVMQDTFDASRLRGETALLPAHAAADAHFGAGVFWVRRLAAMGGEQTTIEYWRVKRSGGQRGIVEIVGEVP